MRLLLFLACVAPTAAPAVAADCGVPGGRCDVDGGFYRLAMPQDAAAPVPAMVFLHGWGGTSGAEIERAGRLALLARRGVALIAPEGVPREGEGRRDWAVADGQPHPRDDLAFLRAVVEDAARRGVDPERILLAGFSRGASMAWEVACHDPDLARAYAPVAGAFWEPLPSACAGSVSLFHTHGWTDRVVPLEGRPVAGGARVQGDLFAGLAILRQADGCFHRAPDQTAAGTSGRYLRRWTDCFDGRVDLMLHPGGHEIPKGWLESVLDWFAALPG